LQCSCASAFLEISLILKAGCDIILVREKSPAGPGTTFLHGKAYCPAGENVDGLGL
jgi:hypothetical protein